MKVLDDPRRVSEIVERTVSIYESTNPAPWRNELPREMNEKLINAIVGFEIPIEKLEGKFKLGQNRAMADQLGALDGLEAAGDPDSAGLAPFVREQLKLTASK